MRIKVHPLIQLPQGEPVVFYYDGIPLKAQKGDTIASALIANNIHVFRHTHRTGEPRGVFCGIGQCTDCVMIVDGCPNTRICVTVLEDGMRVETQWGLGGVGVKLI